MTTSADPEAVPAAVALSAEQALAIRRILQTVLPDARVAVFGSRATGRARPFSDLDLLLLNPPHLNWDQRADLRDAFEASTLPFRVDLVEAAGLAPGMVARVMAESRALP